MSSFALRITCPQRLQERFTHVLAAQAFHWFATQDALKELHRVIRLAGVLGMVWNIEDCEC